MRLRISAQAGAFAACLLSASPGGAQPASPSSSPAAPPLTLHGAIAEALLRHPDLAAIRARAAASALRAGVETPLPPPMLEGEVRQWPIDTINPGNAQLMVSLVQEFPSGDKRRLRAARMSREADMVAGEADLRFVTLAGEVRRAYADLWQARRMLTLQDASASLLAQVAEAATVRYASGRGAQQDVLRALTERVRVEEERVMSAEQGRVAEARLNSLMQRGLDEPIGELDEPPADLDVEPTAVLEARALDGHADLRQADRETAAADAGIESALAERGRDYLVAGGFMVMPDETNAWTARVGVSWPSAPWARGRFDAVTREAEATRAATLAARRAAESRVRLALREARIRVESAHRRSVLLRDAVIPQAEQAFEIARLAYQSDRAGFLDLLEAQRAWVTARLELASAVADRQRAAADLVEALGVPEYDPAPGATR